MERQSLGVGHDGIDIGVVRDGPLPRGADHRHDGGPLEPLQDDIERTGHPDQIVRGRHPLDGQVLATPSQDEHQRSPGRGGARGTPRIRGSSRPRGAGRRSRRRRRPGRPRGPSVPKRSHPAAARAHSGWVDRSPDAADAAPLVGRSGARSRYAPFRPGPPSDPRHPAWRGRHAATRRWGHRGSLPRLGIRAPRAPSRQTTEARRRPTQRGASCRCLPLPPPRRHARLGRRRMGAQDRGQVVISTDEDGPRFGRGHGDIGVERTASDDPASKSVGGSARSSRMASYKSVVSRRGATPSSRSNNATRARY